MNVPWFWDNAMQSWVIGESGGFLSIQQLSDRFPERFQRLMDLWVAWLGIRPDVSIPTPQGDFEGFVFGQPRSYWE